MKLITFAIPSYNSQNYLSKAVDSLLIGGSDVEIIIVDDGSTDDTARIADEYAREYPDIVRVIHKKNGGHGSGVNRGLEEATGEFFKVVDSDDWLGCEALASLIALLKTHISEDKLCDIYFTDFIYDHSDTGEKYVRRWNKQFPLGRQFTWDEVGSFRGAEVILMHSILYRTSKLRSTGISLPEHTFYVDNIFAYMPLPHMSTMYYWDVPLYHYYIGRDDQSVNMKNFVKRYEQQIRVMNIMLHSYTYDEICCMPKGLRKYMLHCLDAIMLNTMLFCCSIDDPDRRRAYYSLWSNLKKRDRMLYNELRRRRMSAIPCILPWKTRGVAMKAGYGILCKTIKLG